MLLDYFNTALQPQRTIIGFFQSQIRQTAHMPVGANHEMTIIVREFVHDYKRVFPAGKNKTLLVFIGFPRNAKNAFIRLGSKYVIKTPRRPQNFHETSLSIRLHCRPDRLIFLHALGRKGKQAFSFRQGSSIRI
jgi:hypothetical protein